MSKKGKTLLSEQDVARFMELAKIDKFTGGFINETYSKVEEKEEVVEEEDVVAEEVVEEEDVVAEEVVEEEAVEEDMMPKELQEMGALVRKMEEMYKTPGAMEEGEHEAMQEGEHDDKEAPAEEAPTEDEVEAAGETGEEIEGLVRTVMSAVAGALSDALGVEITADLDDSDVEVPGEEEEKEEEEEEEMDLPTDEEEVSEEALYENLAKNISKKVAIEEMKDRILEQVLASIQK